MHRGSASGAPVLGVLLFCAVLSLFVFPQHSHAAVVYSQLLNEATSTNATLVFYKIPAGTDVPRGLKYIELIAASPANGHGFRATIICRRFSNYTGTCPEMPDFSVTTAGTSTTKAPIVYRMPFITGSTTPLSSSRFYAFGIERTNGDAAGIHLRGIASSTCIITGCGLSGTPYVVLADAFEPEPPSCTENCFSNVLFLPGIKATDLYEGESKRWLPGLFNSDGERLAMDDSGESLYDITVGEPMKKAYGVLEIYDAFEKFLNDIKEEGVILDWQSAPYDWRYDVYDVVAHDQLMRDGSTRSLLGQVRSLAATSKTGKVTLIAHSNGGLVGKALIDALGEDTDLIDRFVMVGTPQLGTPSAIPAMLHGIGQGLPIDAAPFAMSSATARELSENMPGVYGLLPIGGYVETALDPVVEFEDVPATSAYTAAYGAAIDTRDELLYFLRGDEGRTKPGAGDTLTPTVLNESILTNTETSRNLLESWVPPIGIEVVEIVGWGLDTIRGLKYRERSCPLFSGCTFLDIEPLLTAEGDGTVVYPSADTIGSPYYLDMSTFNDANQTSWSHANMLAASSVQDLIRDIMTNTSREATHITTTKPETNASDKRLRLSVHSPITIGIRDEEGRFTGVQPNPDASSNIPVVVQEIPNTYYLAFGEGKYVGFSGGASHEVVMLGTGTGTFTLEIAEVVGDEVADTATYSDIPVATTTLATLTITDITNKGVLAIDEDGDGSVDDLANPDDEAPPIAGLFALIREKITALPLNEGLKHALLNRITELEKKMLKKAVTPQITKQLKVFLRFIAHQAKQEKISDAEAQSINKLIDQLDGGL